MIIDIVVVILVVYITYEYIYKEYMNKKRFLPVEDVDMSEEQREYIIKRLNKVQVYLKRKIDEYPELNIYANELSSLADIRYDFETNKLQKSQLSKLNFLLNYPVVTIFNVDIV